jgi:radical SAM superfamily enzyme YgiQ (UPF0313 family)
MPDNGLALLAGCLQATGHEVEIWDPGTVTTLRDCLSADQRRRLRVLLSKRKNGSLDSQSFLELAAFDEIKKLGLYRIYREMTAKLDNALQHGTFDVLGLKLWFGPGFSAALELAERVGRLHPELRVYAGGPMSTLAPELVLSKSSVVSGICIGEGEEAIVAIADACLTGAVPCGVPNLLLRSDGGRINYKHGTSFATVPPPCYAEEVYPSVAAGDKAPVFYVEDSRGCPRQCWFCGHSLFNGQGTRLRTPADVVDEMDNHHRAFKAKAFRFTGSSTPEQQYWQIAEQLTERERNYLYSGFAHIESWHNTDFAPLRKSGLSALFFGLETGSERVLKESMGKRRDSKRLLERARACLDQGIFLCTSVIFPAPGETDDTEEETFALLCELLEGRPDCAVPIQPAFPQPGSKWGDEMERYGFTGDRMRVLEDMLERRVSRIIPSHLLKPLPYELDGASFTELARRSHAFGCRLSERGILTGISDETVVLALASGRPLRDFLRESDEIFTEADSDRLNDLIQRMRYDDQKPSELSS